jgi:glucose/arabinose dehydrogenase
MREARLPSLMMLLLAIFLSGCGSKPSTPPPSGGPPPTLVLTPVVSGLSHPVDLQFPNDGSNRAFVVQQAGSIRIVASGSLLSSPFLDITAKVSSGGEMGLLGLAFHPQFTQSHLFYVHYDRTVAGQTQSVIAEYHVSAGDMNVADPNSERILLTVDQPFSNHKGGQIVFGPDGLLYIGLGDGGSGGDPMGNGQNLQTMLGKMLRIDVNHQSGGKQYAIPPSNPFANGGGLPEIFAYGLRNPWRFSFERGGTRLFVGDVGQDAFEEVDILESGKNYGWNVMEGLHCYNPSTSCTMTGLTMPILEYPHRDGEAVIGGFIYKGTAISGLSGAYVFGDYISGTIWRLVESPPGTWTRSTLLSSGRNISSFAQDTSGELYVLDYSGSVLQLAPQ